MPLPDDVFSRIAFQRRERMVYNAAGKSATFISANDIVIAKLLAFQKTNSDKHLRDVKGVLVTQWDTLDFALIRRAADHNGLLAQFEQVYEVARWEIGP